MNENHERAVHIIVLPFPVQGHINPMLQFSNRLISSRSEGLVEVTLVTAFINPDLIRVKINVEDISDATEVDRDPRNLDPFLKHFRQLVSLKLPQVVEKQSRNGHPVSFIIYDSVTPWALDIARELGLGAACFFTQPCAVNAIFYNVHRGLLETPPEDHNLPVSMVGLPSLELSDLPSFIQDPESYPSLLQLLIDQFSNFKQADCIFCNTFDSLEQEVVRWLTKQWPVKNIGPTIPSMYLDKRLEDDRDYGLSLFKPEVEICKKWLDTKGDASVVYVAFGSLAVLGEEQMEEIASALGEIDRNFLWVVREAELKKLPRSFVEETAERGLVVSWCHQLEVLAHNAVGCFVTHSGWNSTLEALCLGVAMVSIPQWSDQPTNAKFIMDVWRVGTRARLNPEGIVTRKELERCIGHVMEGDRAEEIKCNSRKWKRLARAALADGGISDTNIREFVTQIFSSPNINMNKFLQN